MIEIDPTTMPKGWGLLKKQAFIESFDEFLDYKTGRWKLSLFCTREKIKNTGIKPYRRPLTWYKKIPNLHKVFYKNFIYFTRKFRVF